MCETLSVKVWSVGDRDTMGDAKGDAAGDAVGCG